MKHRSTLTNAPLLLLACTLLAACSDQLPSAAAPAPGEGGPRMTVIPTVAFDTMDGGSTHACGLDTSGQAYCWGRNSFGQLGDSTAANSSVPVAVYQPGLAFDRITAGGAHTCALNSSDQAYCWGHNADGRLGDSTTVLPLRPVAVLPLGGVAFVQLDAGNAHTCGVNASGQAYCWGGNTSGQVGDSTINNTRITPTPVMQLGGLNFTSISAGTSHTCALSGSGQAYCWGYDGDGALGNGSTFGGRIPQVVQQPAGVTFVQISSNYLHSCGLTSGGQAYCWGENGWGQLGDNSTTDRNAPVAVQQGAISFVSITTGGDFTCGVDASGHAHCWGGDGTQQLGNGTGGASLTPTAVTMPTGVSFAFASIDSGKGCALDTIGQAWCWGRNNYGQVGDGSTTTRNVPTAVSH